jgi:hypothetical protein
MQRIDGMTASWLAARLGISPERIEVLRRGGELVGVRRASGERVFPAWQFGRDLRPLPAVRRLVAAARERGLGDERLHAIVSMRNGLTGGRLGDSIVAHEEQILRAIAQASV